MENYIIAENYTLPSQGKVYGSEIDPHVKIRSMTTAEEQRRLTPSESAYENMCSIIDDCLVEGPKMSSYDMCIGDYQFLLHKLRVVTYGSKYSMTSTCPYCGCPSSDSIDLEDLPILEFEEKANSYLEFDLPKSGKHVKLKVQTPKMIDLVNEKVKSFKKKTNNTQADQTLTCTIAALIDEIDGKKPNPVNLEKWVRELPMADVNMILAHAEKFNDSIGVEVQLKNTCDVCGLEYNTTLKMTSEFFRPALDL